MGQQSFVTYALIASGDTTSATIHLARAAGVTVHVPSLSAVNTMYFTAAPVHDGVFVPVSIAPPATSFFDVGSGKIAVNLTDRYASMGHAKVVFGTAMTEPTTIGITAKIGG